jgi:hypothetical protein
VQKVFYGVFKLTEERGVCKGIFGMTGGLAGEKDFRLDLEKKIWLVVPFEKNFHGKNTNRRQGS